MHMIHPTPRTTLTAGHWTVGWNRLIGGLVLAVLTTGPVRADWPTFRGNVQRTAYVPQDLTAEQWEPLWRSDYLSPPQAAWPPPATSSLWQNLSSIEPRVTEDSGDVPLIVSDSQGQVHVLVTSSANDRLLSLEPASGQVRWEVVTEGPVRFAPSVVDDRVYLGADDGQVRAIDLPSGRILWKVTIGPDLPRIMGNGRLISAHPIRCSVLHLEGQLYAAAGLFPNQGVYLVALQPETGQVIWRRRTDRSPQGYLLGAGDGRIYVPTGRSVPIAISRHDGTELGELPSPGGSFCMLTPSAFFAGPGNAPQVQAQPGAGAKVLSFGGRQIAAGAGRIWSANGSQLVCVDIDAVARGEMQPLWTVECPLQGALIATGTPERPQVFLADGNRIQVHDGRDGQLLHQMQLDDPNAEIKYLAVAAALPTASATGVTESGGSGLEASSDRLDGDLLIATTQRGQVYAWRGRSRTAAAQDPDLADAPEPIFVTAPLAPVADLGDLDSQAGEWVERIIETLPSPRGLALVVDDRDGAYIRHLVQRTELTILAVVGTGEEANRLQASLQARGWYGHRVAVQKRDDFSRLPYAPGLFNLVLAADPAAVGEDETDPSSAARMDSWRELLAAGVGLLVVPSADVWEVQAPLADAGVWRHQYATPANLADGRDSAVGRARGFRLQWYGGVGPHRMPDRHLRGGAPLAAGAALVMQGDGVLIGVDPANGVERWQQSLPQQAMRYVMPYDGPYTALSQNGRELWIAVNAEIWQLNAYTGDRQQSLVMPQEYTGMHWGYLAWQDQAIYASVMNPAAARTARDRPTRYSFVNDDYNSQRPLVTSRALIKWSADGQQQWAWPAQGVIVHGSIALADDQRDLIFVEGRSEACRQHVTDRIPLSVLMEEAHLVCLDPATGKRRWERPLIWPGAENMLYGQITEDRIILSSSESREDRANYMLRVLDRKTGDLLWEAKHRHIKDGLFHGEQVHHPVVLRRNDGREWLFAEPFAYDLNDGRRLIPEGADASWGLNRPGHSCGTMTGSGDCLFFRANHPTVLDLSQPGGQAFTALAPSRAGCWINMIPAGGRLLIPEGSASCVCNYSLQTSMAFLPLADPPGGASLPLLPDVAN